MVFALIIGLLCLFPFLLRYRKGSLLSKPLVQVVVLGDIGHSPRMQYHALSLANTGKVGVELIGFRGSKPLDAVTHCAEISIRVIRQVRIAPTLKVPFAIYAIIKVLFECLQLFLILVATKQRPEVIIVQTPPAIPSILVCGLVSFFSGSKLVVDFHNITYMHLGTKVHNPVILGVVRLYEKWVTRILAHECLTVTKSMRNFLITNFGLRSVHTLYDRPGPQFKGRSSASVKEDLEARLVSTGIMKNKLSSYDFVLASSTSWTKDEDFSLMLRALPQYSAKTFGKKTLLFITGKGEMEEQFVHDFSKLNLTNVELVTAWLPAADYPLLLGAADVGISVHTSTSGLDLPMKAVDMLGSELPVVALDFPSLSEMLGNGEGGVTFNTSEQLADSLARLVESKELREKYSRFGFKFRTSSDWKSEWLTTAWPVIEKYIPRRSRQSRRRP